MLKVGIIGVGGIAGTHIPGWVASEDAELVAGCDMDESVLQEWGKKHNVQKLYTDPNDMFADSDIDIVDVCTPNNYHAPLSIGALNAGKHVICEKPLAPKPDQIQEMIAARDKSGKLLMCAQSSRFAGSSLAMKAEVDKGVLGDVYHARCWMLRRSGVPGRPGFIMKEHSGGGPCIDIGVHVLDLTLWLMGNPKPVAVTGVARAELAHQPGAFSVMGRGGGDLADMFDVEDFAAAFVRFENGATLILETSWMLHHGQTSDRQIWLYGTQGGAHLPNCEIYHTDNETKQHYNYKLQNTDHKMKAHALECVEFARAITEGKPSPVPAEQSLQVMAILDGIYRSQEAGKELVLDI
ncbi:MAG: Gfo/Idh/MocA family oxidoreductase [Candidatus Latescibacteria bacterium]|jgi:predicted dehydrogenase|nr:Gfo/Idh/MocA family oxidoreductase [Candidatus Latescibacterota bacterium]